MKREMKMKPIFKNGTLALGAACGMFAAGAAFAAGIPHPIPATSLGYQQASRADGKLWNISHDLTHPWDRDISDFAQVEAAYPLAYGSAASQFQETLAQL